VNTPLPSLTSRQRQVAELVAVGRSNQAIASRLRICEKTVEKHVSALLRKLGVRSRTQLAIEIMRDRTR
jgi:DNA-binding NarL/FixJ family response regulator